MVLHVDCPVITPDLTIELFGDWFKSAECLQLDGFDENQMICLIGALFPSDEEHPKDANYVELLKKMAWKIIAAVKKYEKNLSS